MEENQFISGLFTVLSRVHCYLGIYLLVDGGESVTFISLNNEFNSSRLYTLSARLNALHIVSCSVCPLMVCRQSTVSLMLTLNPNHFVEGVYQIISLLVESRGSLIYRIVTLENRIFFLTTSFLI